MKLNKWILAGTALTGAFAAHSALAQSTGTQAVEEVTEVVVSGQRNRSLEGLAVVQTVTKTRSSIDEQFIDKQLPGVAGLDAINLLPGVNFTSNDATGMSGGDITLRGFDAQRVSLTLDGMPVNDTGNYQIYTTQLPDSDLFSRVDVNLGTTDVDSPTAAASGGTLSYLTKKPLKEMGGQVKLGFGSYNYQREFVRFDTGEFGPFGTTSYLSASYNRTDKFKGPGNLERKQVNGKVYQPLGDNGDFVSAAFLYMESRNHFIRRNSLAQIQQDTINDYDETAGAGPGFNSNYYGYSINPTDTGNVRIQFKKHLTDNLTFTFDPSFQYTLANGGGTTTINEVTGQIGTAGVANPINRELTGVDINGDGRLSTSVRTYSPSNTKTRRFMVTSSLIWRINDNSVVRAAYSYDRGSHRQTGAYSLLNATGSITDEFSSERGNASPVLDKFGNNVQKRNRHSFAELSQFAINYTGTFFDNSLKFDIGLRAPKLTRDLNNYCYQMNTFTAYCSTNPTAAADARAAAGATAAIQAPVSFTKEYDKVLPNLGVSYKINNNQSIYASYAETLSAPRTDDLYDSKIPNLVPEHGKTVDLGYRYSAAKVSANVAVWHTDFAHRIERAYDDVEQISTSTDIGDVTMQGFNAEVGFRPVEGLNIYASTSYTDSEIADNVKTSATAVQLTAGKKLNKYPKFAHAVRVNYETGNWDFGVQGKYTGDRYSTLLNTEIAPAYTVWDANVSYSFGNFGPMKDTQLQLNVKNLFDERYAGAISPSDVFAANVGFNYQLGAPTTAVLTLNTKF
ncbi:TonB-dependent receptor [Asticcacaulis sp. AND118]|uniref:TonB-dependent receptor n=1 Tax=Asticcacaulis sp. AND118 TaxID=2840468 RepID=UPI001CFF6F57|nr:TonB-dependent receptor [Asticcacaulis sp. AND118]UDF04244.1 TonB-dependent receptor [Asticcacaulis sp. AND118]